MCPQNSASPFFRRIASLAKFVMTGIGLSASVAVYAQQEVSPSATTEAAKQAFIQELAQQHQIDPDYITQLLDSAQRDEQVLQAIQRPWEARPWHQYHGIFLTERRIQQGVAFWNEHQDTLARAEQEFGVPASLIVAIIGVETFYGQYMGNYRVLDSLYSLGFYYPPRERFFRSELGEFIRLAAAEGLDPEAIKGSYAGAMGYGQFISSSYRAYAVDFDGDGQRDLLNNKVDAIGSVANYFARHRYQKGQPVAVPAWPNRVEDLDTLVSSRGQNLTHTVGSLRAAGVDFITQMGDDTPARLFRFDEQDGASYWVGLPNFYSITRYNHSPLYALAVHLLSEEIRHAKQQ
ncbi:lytic murein transglycosylase B [Aliidiomarina maris]|uniref:Membrane-bound lytic murein transglycosylase B n=2 Tax=Aliidiomarina maris TaxID=531312 RepID=A0A327WUW9_9GAMM|nr:lytic murein transglycosylase B [Aliidiomarina maris]RAJ96825.1 membrane-bound lytic murein transglycosylase B [Aliidiomarina maris]